MSRYCGGKDIQPILVAAAAWKEKYLLDNGAINYVRDGVF